MEQKTIVKLTRVGRYIISFIVLFFTILIGFNFWLLVRKSHTFFEMGYGIFVICILIFFGWIFPILLYRKQPKHIRISESKLTIININGKEQIILKGKIHKLKINKDPIDKKKIFLVYYNKKKPLYCINFDEDSGKKIWNWYYDKGYWSNKD